MRYSIKYRDPDSQKFLTTEVEAENLDQAQDIAYSLSDKNLEYVIKEIRMTDTKKEPAPAAKTPGTEVAAPAKTAVGAPINWRDHMKAVATKVVEQEKPSGSFISFKGGRLSIGDAVAPGDKIDCIILYSLFHNKYYDQPYDSKRQQSPACYAFNTTEEDLAPHEKAEDPQGGEDGYCAGCPMAEWGSSPKGGRGKACMETRRIWVLPADLVNKPDKIGRADTMQFDLPVTSVKNFSKLVQEDLGPTGLPPFAFICEVSVKPHEDTLFQVYFKPLEKIKDEAVLEQLAMRNYKLSQEPVPTYPTKEEVEKMNQGPAAGGNRKF